MGGVVPVVDEGGVQGGEDEGAAGKFGDTFGDGREFGGERGFRGDELGEQAGVAGGTGADAGVERERDGPLGGNVAPAGYVDALRGFRVGVTVSKAVVWVLAIGGHGAATHGGVVFGGAGGRERSAEGAKGGFVVWRLGEDVEGIAFDGVGTEIEDRVVWLRDDGEDGGSSSVFLAEFEDVVDGCFVEPAGKDWDVVAHGIVRGDFEGG